jgi:hypothetical protein
MDRTPTPVFTAGSTEFSVHLDRGKRRYVEVQSVGFGDSDISLRWSNRLVGPWSQLERTYAGKAHPELIGADLIATYAANAAEERLTKDMSVYFPRFVKIHLHD